MRLIDADALDIIIRTLIVEKWNITRNDYKLINAILSEFPTIEPEQKTGEWIEVEVTPKTFDVNGIETWASKMQCDQCGFITYAIEGHMGQYNFCPSCGAKMGA